jgi:site-specific DNA recombinase
MNEADRTIAVLYCRVSTVKQTIQGTGLASQETRCREFAKMKGYEVTEVFQDDVSGRILDRPGIRAMLSYLRKHKTFSPVVIIDDISRLARDIETHLKLRAAIAQAGGRLESPSGEFEDGADGQLVEMVKATFAQHQAQKNAEQSKNRMRARMMNGYYALRHPKGYRYELVRGRGKMLMRDEPVASIIAEALEGFACGRYQSIAELQRFLQSQPHYPRPKSGRVHEDLVKGLLTCVLYAGYLERPEWQVDLRPAHHEALISFETFQRIQARLAGGAKAPSRKNISADFPLRGFITCAECGKPYTAAWSQSRNGTKHPYYFCHQKGCSSFRKSIRRDVLEGEFEALLATMRPTAGLFEVASAMFRDGWDQRRAQSNAIALRVKNQIAQIEKKAEQLVDRLVEASSDTLVKAYEKRIATLDRDRVAMGETMARLRTEHRTFDEMFEHAMRFLKNPGKIWASEHLSDKRAVLKLAFADQIAYDRKHGLRTAHLAYPFKALAAIMDGRKFMVGDAGIEPATPAV